MILMNNTIIYDLTRKKQSLDEALLAFDIWYKI